MNSVDRRVYNHQGHDIGHVRQMYIFNLLKCSFRKPCGLDGSIENGRFEDWVQP